MFKNLDITFDEREKISTKIDIINTVKLFYSDNKSIFLKLKEEKVSVFNNSEEKHHIYKRLVETLSKVNDNEESFIKLLPIELNLSCDGVVKSMNEFNDKQRFYLISVIFKKLIDNFGVESGEEYYILRRNTFYKFTK